MECDFGSRSLGCGRSLLPTCGREKKALGAAHEWIAAFVKAQELVRGTSNADADAPSDSASSVGSFAQPERSAGA